MVRKSLCFLLLSALIVTMTMPFHSSAAAADAGEVIDYSAEDLGNGITVESVITLSSTRTLRSASNTSTFKRDGKEIAKVTLYATFTYNGSLASVWSTDYSKSTSLGWFYRSHQITTMDRMPSATATLDAKLQGIVGIIPVHITLRCSPTGTITK
ncbi:MAG: hypothetical protein SOR61_04025 [Evtepia sp.]|uniref:hypothetical protein n=1 Tax=Evtepia sp. TaxID=2773933 RepID=UPI002A749A57|nr:hypothetical protein [Evtepia sp.]MDY3014352.1 hypothetical protein [Evtepia sp.]